MTNETLPSHLRESNFRQYEQVWADAVNNYPREVVVDPKKLNRSPVTVAQRIRDARSSCLRYGWPTTLFPVARLAELANDLQVIHEPSGLVKIRSKTAVTPVQGEANEQEPLNMCDQGYPEIRLLCRLASKRALSRKLLIFIDNPQDLEAAYDINLERLPNGTYLLS